MDGGSVQEVMWRWLSRLLCAIGCHDWRDGPGFPCRVCGRPDWFGFA